MFCFAATIFYARLKGKFLQLNQTLIVSWVAAVDPAPPLHQPKMNNGHKRQPANVLLMIMNTIMIIMMRLRTVFRPPAAQ